MTKLEKLEKESTVQEKSLTIVDNPEIVLKLKNKVKAAPEKMKKMNNKWINYENEQKLILSKLIEEANKNKVSNSKLLFYKIRRLKKMCKLFIIYFFFNV